MKLPVEISPNPLVTSTIELRFSTQLSSNDLFPVVYKAFLEILPKLELSNLPPDIKSSNQQFKFAPDYILSNDSYKLSFSNTVLSFEHVSEYQFWKNYFPFVSKCIDIFFGIVKVDFIERIGVRYASVLDKTENANQVLISVPGIGLEGYEEKFEHYRSIIKANKFNLLLQVFENAKAVKKDQTISGVYIDIDASFEDKIEPDGDVLEIVDQLHSEQKKLFFSLLKEGYIQTLNPKY
jgi:uncharacterized protein (TIGR04255 family)